MTPWRSMTTIWGTIRRSITERPGDSDENRTMKPGYVTVIICLARTDCLVGNKLYPYWLQ